MSDEANDNVDNKKTETLEEFVESRVEEEVEHYVTSTGVKQSISKELQKLTYYDPLTRASFHGRKMYAIAIVLRAISYISKLLKDYRIEREVNWDSEPITMVVKVWYSKPKRKENEPSF